MTQTFTENVLIDGSQDAEQLRVQGHTTQNEPLQTWEDSAGDTLAQVTGDGRFQIGSFDGGAMATDDALIEAYRDENDTAKPKRGLHLLGEITGTLSEVIQWVVQELALKGSGGISALHSALRVRLTNENTGDAGSADLRAGDFEVENQGGSSASPVGQATGIRVAVTSKTNGYLTDAVGVDVAIQKDGGAISNAFGLRVDDIDQGSGDNYAIHTGEGTVHLGSLGDGMVRSDSGDLSVLKDNLSASAAPTTGDDSGDGYSVGSRWIDTTNDKEYVCVDATTGSAVWIETTGAGGGSGSTPFNHRAGLDIRKLSDGEILVGAGSAAIAATLVEKTTNTVLNLATAANWIGGSSLEAASSWVNVYIDASGNILLHDTLPNYPVADTASRVATMRVNQAGWNGTASNGLNAASAFGYDGDTGDTNIAAGMYLGVYTDSDYTQGRGKGSGASGSKNDLSFALITAVDTGANTITLAAGHQIAINDNDYLIVVQAGAPIFTYISSTWYRWLGALLNNASSNLTNYRESSYAYTANEGANYTTTSGAFVPVDATNMSPKLITSGFDIDVSAFCNVQNSSTWYTDLDVLVDGVGVGDDGYHGHFWGAGYTMPLTLALTLRGLLPGSHTIALAWKSNIGGGTSTIFAGAGTAYRDWHPVYSVVERKQWC